MAPTDINSTTCVQVFEDGANCLEEHIVHDTNLPPPDPEAKNQVGSSTVFPIDYLID